MEHMVIVDNAVYSFGFQLDNGIPIIPFYDNPKDEEFFHLMSYIKSLSMQKDMRTQNRNSFQLSALDSSLIETYLAAYYCNQQQLENNYI
jgi:CTD small phosphatase-like protein 2